MKRGFRYRLYPTPEQALMMARSCGVARLAYNVSLEQRALAYRVCGRSVGWVEQDAEWVALKKDPEYVWLREVHSDVIGQALRDLETAFKRFFAGDAGCPRRDRRGERDSFRLCQGRGKAHVSIEVRRLNAKVDVDSHPVSPPRLWPAPGSNSSASAAAQLSRSSSCAA